jgi:hypothetical protein
MWSVVTLVNGVFTPRRELRTLTYDTTRSEEEVGLLSLWLNTSSIDGGEGRWIRLRVLRTAATVAGVTMVTTSMVLWSENHYKTSAQWGAFHPDLLGTGLGFCPGRPLLFTDDEPLSKSANAGRHTEPLLGVFRLAAWRVLYPGAAKEFPSREDRPHRLDSELRASADEGSFCKPSNFTPPSCTSVS